MFLKIENIGVADYDAFLLLGVSTTRNSSCSETIGMFGSGTKHAICVMLRHGLNPIFYIDQLRMEFFTRNKSIAGVSGIGQNVNQVCVKLSGKTKEGRTVKTEKELGFVQEFGEIDWTDLNMGLREFVSNALDASHELGKGMNGVEIEPVEDNQVRAKAGYTRIFIYATPEVNKFYSSLGSRFLHFTQEDVYKSNVMVASGQTGRIYRRGVLVGELSTQSVFDYNIRNLELDESRNVKDYTARTEAGQQIVKGDVETIATFLRRAVCSTEKFWEDDIPSYSFDISYLSDNTKIRENWNNAWESVFGENAVLCIGDKHSVEKVEKKGYKPIVTKLHYHNILCKLGIRDDVCILTELERLPNEYSEPPQSLVNNVTKIWNWLWAQNLTNSKEMPNIRVFSEIVKSGSIRLGFFNAGDNTIYFNNEILGGETRILNKVILQELTHYITCSLSGTVDVQDFLLDVAIRSIET